LRHLADVVAVVERGDAGVPEVDHRLDVVLHAGARGLLHRSRIALALVAPLGHRPALRQVTVDRVVRRGLVGHDVRVHAALYQFRKHVCRIAEQPDRLRLARLGPALDHLQRLVQRGGLLVEVAGADAEVDAGLVALDRQAAGTGKHGCERLRTAHAAKARRQYPLAR
jgi:hypothetical protein